MVTSTERELQERVGASAGKDATWHRFHAISDQRAALLKDVGRVRSHPLVADEVLVGGFVYDVDTGLLNPVD